MGSPDIVRDRYVVAAIDFHETRIFPTDAQAGQPPERIVAPDPHGRYHKVHHQAGNPSGTYEADSPQYWQAITEALAPAAAILVLGHGKGRANAAHHWVDHVATHRRDVADKVVAVERVDLDDLDDRQVLRLAQHAFGAAFWLA